MQKQTQNDQKNLRNLIIEFLNMLNDGNTVTLNELNQNHKEISKYIYKFEIFDDFQIRCRDSILYCTQNDSRKTLDKYDIENIADLLLEYDNDKIDITGQNYSEIILNYIKNNKDGKHIEHIIYDFKPENKDCIDTKKIKKMILDCKITGKDLLNEIIYYATKTKYAKNIANIITGFNKDLEFSIKLQDISKEINLPRRDDEVYKRIACYEPYELTHCISYEIAIRNEEVKTIIEKLKYLALINKDFFITELSYKNKPTIEYIEVIEEKVQELKLNLDKLEIKHNIDFETFKLNDIQSSIYKLIAEYSILLEEEYYIIYDRKDIMPKGMEEIFKEPNHYESDIELNSFMDKVIRKSISNCNESNYEDNYVLKDGYTVYQGAYKGSNSYDINKIKPNFKRPMREFNQTEVSFNMSLPKDEIIAYISKIKDDYDNNNTSYKTLNQLLYEDDTRTEEKLEHNQQNRYADDFFIYDYYTQSGESHENKLEIIQKKLSQYHGMKIENGRNNYKPIDYDEAIIKMQSKSTTNNSNSLDDLVARFQENEHIIHYIETIKIIENRYESLKNAIDNKRYKKLIHHE